MQNNLPQHARAWILRHSPDGRQPLFHDIVLEQRPIPPLKEGEILVKMAAASFNHRELWQRYGLYPHVTMGSAIGADGAGTVIASKDPDDPLLHRRVFLVPVLGWHSHPDAPESKAGLGGLGGSNLTPLGTFADYVVVDRDQVLESPSHLDDVHVAAWPVGGLTAYRAALINGGVDKDQNVLITGIGGGVALFAMQLCLAKGANVYVSSGSEEKIAKAVELGAKGGVNYKDDNWPTKLAAILARDGMQKLDVIIDSGGGDIMGKTTAVLKNGGRVVCYGMTGSQQISFTMRQVLKNQRLIGSSAGSYIDLVNATEFLNKHRFTPVVSHVLDGLESAEEGFKLIEEGSQFGKVVIKM